MIRRIVEWIDAFLARQAQKEREKIRAQYRKQRNKELHADAARYGVPTNRDRVR